MCFTLLEASVSNFQYSPQYILWLAGWIIDAHGMELSNFRSLMFNVPEMKYTSLSMYRFFRGFCFEFPVQYYSPPYSTDFSACRHIDAHGTEEGVSGAYCTSTSSTLHTVGS